MSTDTGTERRVAQEDSGSDPIIGKVIDGCRIDRKIGQGGMGVVYLAIHEGLDQRFCIKILNPALVGSEDTVERFFREAQACAQLNHPSIVAVQEVGQEGDYYFIRMEFVEGQTLEEMVKEQQKLDWRLALQMVLDTAEALAHAHQKGMIHRDIKPENIMYTPRGEVKVMDFGLAKHVHSSAKVSVTGQIVGTPFFMSPEQAGGKPTDARSDIYSLGVTLYYLVTGVKPFNGKNLQEIFLKHFFYTPESPKSHTPDLPEGLCEVVRRCLKKKKKERYQSAKAMARDLKAILDDPSVSIGGDASASSVGPVDDDDDDMGHTVRVGGGDEGQTVRVGGAPDDMDEATVRVNGQDDGEATVKVGGQKRPPRRPGDIQTVSFKSASMVMSPDAPVADYRGPGSGSDDPTAGLDLPEVPDYARERGPEPVLGGGGGSKKKLLAIALLIGVPLLLYAGLVGAARARFGSLSTQYEQAKASNDLDRMKAAAAELDQFAGSFSGQISGLREQAASMSSSLGEITTGLERTKVEEEKEKRLREEKLHELQEQAAADAEAREQGLKALQELAALKDAKKWREYSNKVLDVQAKYKEVLPDEIKALRMPVFVTSYPDGATVTLGSDGSSVTTPGVLWVRPRQRVDLTFELEGFKKETRTADATEFLAFDASLNRLVLRTINLGLTSVRVGARLVEEPLEPVHPLQVDVSTGIAYFVGQDGYLHDVTLDERGPPPWEPNEIDHKIGVYGDPTPTLKLVPGHVILISSLLGKITAHTPSNAGQKAWELDTGSPVTSPPGYDAKERVLAAGLMDGDVVFATERGDELWRFHTQNQVITAPYFLRGKKAVLGSTDNRLYTVDWGNKAARPLSMLDLGDDVVQGPVPLGRYLVVATANGVLHLIGVDADSGRLRALQRTSLGESRVGGVVVDGSRVFFSRGNELHGYKLGDKGLEELWKPVKGGGQLTAATLRGNLAYVGSDDCSLLAVDVETGTVSWPQKLEDPVRVPPLVYNGELFVVSSNKLVVLKAD